VTRAWGDGTRGDGFKQKEGRYRLHIQKKFSTMRVVEPWPRLPRAVVDAPSPTGFKARLDWAGSSLTQLKLALPMAGGAGLGGL